MKTLLASTALVSVLFAGPAFAADLVEPVPLEAPPAVLPYDWSGPYIGIHGGYEWGEDNDTFDDILDPFIDQKVQPADQFDTEGFLAGVHGGFNRQYNSFVVGIEGDFSYSDLEGEADFEAVFFGPGFTQTFSGDLSVDQDWQASLRLRAGFAVDRFLIYATAGGAFADVNVSVDGEVVTDFDFDDDDDDIVDGFDDEWDDIFIGWTAGLGGEYAVTDNILVRVEGRYTDLGEQSFDADDLISDDDDDDDDEEFEVELDSVSVRGGISFKF